MACHRDYHGNRDRRDAWLDVFATSLREPRPLCYSRTAQAVVDQPPPYRRVDRPGNDGLRSLLRRSAIAMGAEGRGALVFVHRLGRRRRRREQHEPDESGRVPSG